MAALAVAGCGAPANGNPSAPAVQRVGSLTLLPSAKPVSWSLPLAWGVTMRVRFPAARSTLRVGLGAAAVMVFDGSHIWHRVKLSARGLVVDGRASGGSALTGSSMTLEALHGPVEVETLVIRRTGH